MRQNRHQFGEQDSTQRRSQKSWGRQGRTSQGTWPRSRWSSSDRDYEQSGYEPGFSSSYRSGTSYYPGTGDRNYAMGSSYEENAQNYGRPFSDFDRYKSQGGSQHPWTSSSSESGYGREQYGRYDYDTLRGQQQDLGHQWGSSGISSYGSQSPYGRTQEEGEYRGSTSDEGRRSLYPYGTISGSQSQSPYARQYGQDYETYRGGNQFNQQYSSNGQKSQGKGPKGYRRSDERIREDVCESLSQHPMIDASEVEVNINEGVITLSGTVESRQMKRMIEDCIEGVSGVKDVKNEIKVEPSSSSTSMSSSSSRSGSDTSTTSGRQSQSSKSSMSSSRHAQ